MEESSDHHEESVDHSDSIPNPSTNVSSKKTSNATRSSNSTTPAKPKRRKSARGRELLSLIGIPSRSPTPEPTKKRRPTSEERVAARNRAREIQEQLDESWKHRNVRKKMEADKKKYEKIADGGFIGGGGSAVEKRGRSKGHEGGRQSKVKNMFPDSDPEIDSLGYRKGEREKEDRRFEALARKRVAEKGGTFGSPEGSEEDTDPPAPTKRRRARRTKEPTPNKKAAAAKPKHQNPPFTFPTPAYAPILPPTTNADLDRTSTSPYLAMMESQAYYNPIDIAHGLPIHQNTPITYTTYIPSSPSHTTVQKKTRSSSSSSKIEKRSSDIKSSRLSSVFEQRLAVLRSGSAVPETYYPPEVVGKKPSLEPSIFEREVDEVAGEEHREDDGDKGGKGKEGDGKECEECEEREELKQRDERDIDEQDEDGEGEEERSGEEGEALSGGEESDEDAEAGAEED